MFVKRDERKIPQILAEASAVDKTEKLTELRLARRPKEFNGSISILCQPSYASALHDLTSLSLYDCNISSLSGIGFFAFPQEKKNDEDETGYADGVYRTHLKELNIGMNPLNSLPSELSLLSNSLTSLWLDDCKIVGVMPECLYQLVNLEILRISNNKITTLQGRNGVEKWEKMKVLCLDGNMIEEIPVEFAKLRLLESLLFRNNKLSALPEGVPGANHENLSLIHLSSNCLKSLPASICQCVSLKTIYANANKLSKIPEDMAENLTRLESVTFCNNLIDSLDVGFLERFGEPDEKHGKCQKDPACTVNLDQNPIIDKKQQELSSSMDTT